MEKYSEFNELKAIYNRFRGLNAAFDNEMTCIMAAVNDTMVLVYLRRALEVIIEEMVTEKLRRKRGNEPLKGLIDKLFHDEHIPQYIYNTLLSLNQTATFGAHPKEFNQRQVRVAIMEFSTFMEWYSTTIDQKITAPIIEHQQESLEEEKEQPIGSNSNPFFNRAAIQDKRYFIGRDDIIQKIFSLITAEKPQSISINGERRIGKSSILCYINNPKVHKSRIPKDKQYIFIYIDFQRFVQNNPNNFFHTILSSSTIPDELRPRHAGDNGYTVFDAFVKNCDSKKIRIILLFDEFEKITNNPSFDIEFYSYLRHLANCYNLAIITSSFRSLMELCHSNEIADSPFFNIFSAYRVGLFKQAEAEQLIDHYLQEYPEKDRFRRYLPMIYSETGFHPFFMQVFCSVLYDHLRKSQEIVPADVEKDFAMEVREHFRFIWEKFSSHEKEVMKRIVHNHGQLDKKDRHIVNELSIKGLIVGSENAPHVFSKSFSVFIAESAPHEPGRSWWSVFFKNSSSGNKSGK